jgi:hypothetical protein
MLLFYRSINASILRYGIATLFGNMTVQLKAKILRLIKTAGKIFGLKLPSSLQDIFEETISSQ